MRILFAHDHQFRSAPGGAVYTPTSFAASAWDRYLEHFDELRVVSRAGPPVADGANLARSDRDGVSFDFLPSLSSLRQLAAPSAEATARMGSAIDWADAVVARLPSEIGLMAVREAQRLGKPYAIELVGCPWDALTHHGSPAARLYAPVMVHRTRRAVKSAPMVLYVTAKWLQGRYPTDGVAAIASNVEIVPVTDSARASRERRLKELAAGRPPILGTVASLRVKSKGIQTAIPALARVRASGLDLTYRVLGPGDTEPWVALTEKNGVSDLVHFDGTRSAGEGVSGWLDEIDIYLQPSFHEGLPRATIEAMSRGAACIGSTCGGIPELLPSNRLHRPGDVAALAKIVRRLASDPSEIAMASRADRDTARSYDPEILRSRRSDFFRRLRDISDARHNR
ncbi:MAG TPA: glycosyltransferase family 4 protein [Sphingomicrobium sp.]|nr:glycosyltransferase family 4 protein [Sphingomicrobium sp.]